MILFTMTQKAFYISLFIYAFLITDPNCRIVVGMTTTSWVRTMRHIHKNHHFMNVRIQTIESFQPTRAIKTTILNASNQFSSTKEFLSNNIQTNDSKQKSIAVIGGGASGIFASIAAAAETISTNDFTVTVFEGTRTTLAKVKVSGGGRCNVMHDTTISVPVLLSKGYPRGSKELKSIYHQKFTPNDAKQWFVQRGVQLKTESDGRMFPISDASQTIIDTLLHAARQSNVQINKQSLVISIEKILSKQNENDIESNHNNCRFKVTYAQKSGDSEKISKEAMFDAVILATGSSIAGYKLAQSLGHSIIQPVPSLFTLNTPTQPGSLLHGLAGLTVPYAHIRLKVNQPKPSNSNISTSSDDLSKKTKRSKVKIKYLQQEGPLLITHNGLSGPAALRLSAFAARELADMKYCCDLIIHWAPTLGNADTIFEQLWDMTNTNPKRTIASRCPLVVDLLSIPSIPGAKLNVAYNDVDEEYDEIQPKNSKTAIPKRLWHALVKKAGFDVTTSVWGQASKKLVRQLACLIAECTIPMTGKNTNKEEFVTAGGIDCSQEIHMATMASRCCDGLFFCGEIINVDGVTGGFNFMNCWGTGYVAGISAAKYVSNISHNDKLKQLYPK